MNFFSKLLLLALLYSPLPLHADVDTGRPNPELAPSGEADQACAQAGLDTINADLEMAM